MCTHSSTYNVEQLSQLRQAVPSWAYWFFRRALNQRSEWCGVLNFSPVYKWLNETKYKTKKNKKHFNSNSIVHLKRNDKGSWCTLCVTDVAQHSRYSQRDARIQRSRMRRTGRWREVPWGSHNAFEVPLQRFSVPPSPLQSPSLTHTPSASSVGHIFLHVSPPPPPSQSGSHPVRIPPVETREGRRRISRWCGEMEVWRGTSEGPVLHLGKVSEVWWDMGGSWLHCTATVCGIPSLITPLISQRNKWLLSSAPTLIACTLAHNVPPLRATIQSLCLPSAL